MSGMSSSFRSFLHESYSPAKAAILSLLRKAGLTERLNPLFSTKPNCLCSSKYHVVEYTFYIRNKMVKGDRETNMVSGLAGATMVGTGQGRALPNIQVTEHYWTGHLHVTGSDDGRGRGR
jgi:hypothetical protein